MTSRSGLGTRRPGASIAAVLAALALGACGGGEDEEPATRPEAPEAPEQAEDAPADAGDRGSGRDGGAPRDGGEGASREPERAQTGSAGCAFAAPPGRLARDQVAIELEGVPCEDAVPLARAAALGQPAGANLTIDSRGYRCEPSSMAKGDNVTYTCKGPSGSAVFDVVWSEPG